MRNKKILYMFIIFLIILFFFSFKESNAYTFTSKINGNTYTVPDLDKLQYSHYIDRMNNNGYILCVNGSNFELFVGYDNTAIFFNNSSNNLGSTIYGYGKIAKFTANVNSTQWAFGNLYTMGNGSSLITSTNTFNNVVEYGGIIYKNYTKDEVLYDPNEVVVFPSVTNVDSDLSNGTDSYFLIHPGTFSGNDNITFDILLVENETTSEIMYQETLNNNSPYYKSVVVGNALEFWYEIPFSDLSFNFIKEKSYLLTLSGVTDKGEWSVTKQFKFIGMSEEDIYHSLSSDINKAMNTVANTITAGNENLQNSIEQQTEVQEEQLETSKGIWASIKEVISYINPFSENFFVYKLIDLLIDALKSLFIPGEGFLDTYFSELLNWFSDRLGFLSYPLELILDVLNRILTINFEEPIINIPDIYEPSTNIKIISERSFNFNSLLENNTLKTVHDIYLILVDAVIVFGLVNLLKNKLEEVFTK